MHGGESRVGGVLLREGSKRCLWRKDGEGKNSK